MAQKCPALNVIPRDVGEEIVRRIVMKLSARKIAACTASLLLSAAICVNAQKSHSQSQPSVVASTVPANGNVNPYGIARVPKSSGALVQGNILISNFNNSNNLQGTGSTIVQVWPNGNVSQFAQINPSNLPGPCPGGVGLTTALVVLRSGWVVVGSLPTSDGTSATAQAGCLLVLNNQGMVVETFYGSLINGPWDMTAWDTGDFAELFVTNVLNGTVAGNGSVVNQGTVTRLDLNIKSGAMPWLQSISVIGSGFSERTDSAALVIGPTGLALDREADTLYIADSVNNRIAAIRHPVFRDTSAGTGTTVSQGGNLNDPLGLTVGPDGNIITVNGGDGFLVETTPRGKQIQKALLDNTGTPPGSGALFGLIDVNGSVFYVDDAGNTLNLFQLRSMSR